MAATTVTARELTTLVAQLGGLAILAGTLAAATALVYRWYVREAVPAFLALLIGLSGVAVYLNTTPTLSQVIDAGGGPTGSQIALFNIVAFATGAAGAAVGRRVGDRFETDVFLGAASGRTERDEEVGRLVSTLGRVHEVALPEDIGDVVGYDPVPEETKEALAGRRFVFPRSISLDELEARLTTRLKTDYAVGHVDLELTPEGDVAYLAVGSRAAGIGPTLPPATNAVAVRADPAFSASAGDLVQVWETDPMRRVLTAELRGVSEDVVTLAIDAADTPKVDPTTQYRLVTLPVDDRPDREFASLLRAAEATFTAVTVEPGSVLHGLPVGALSVDIVAIQPEDGSTVALPTRRDILEPGDVVFAIARPEQLRRLEAASEALPPELESSVAPSSGAPSPSEALSAPAGDAAADGEAAGDAGAGDPGESQPTPADAAEATGQEGTDPGGQEERGSGSEATEAAPDPDASGAASDDQAADDEDSVVPDADLDTEARPFEDIEAELDDEGAEPASGAGTAAETGGSAGEEAEKGGGEDAPADEFEALAVEDVDDGDLAFDEDEDDLGFEDDDLAFDEGPGEVDDGGLDFGAEPDQDRAPQGEVGGGSPAEGDADGDAGDGADDDEGDDDDGEDDDEDEDEGGAGDDGDEGGGGGGTFAQLKEEFESGDADWADDISDSPGGDMRLEDQ